MSDSESYISGQESPKPEIPIKVGEGNVIVLTWYNTVMRKFGEGNGEYDHATYEFENGNIFAFRPTEELKEKLKEKTFPYRFDPQIDEATRNWYSDLQNHILEQELAEGDYPQSA